MRIQIKGGIWKNTEDEILKAAVMKYGLNQWARISSLLVRKSAKQCKARWFEWLDPAIKKTEWTREEDEKLLHLAKLMPTQWRTIAPIVGRTPAQCLDRYERLLDMAVSKEDKYDPSDDPRRLRPGEIDPNPEAKPAKPDAIDMDEEEKEMLSEARARLANTRGKKAKRKARERQMEEARRLAALQKRRELKAAGIEVNVKDKKKRTIDYNAEVAFEKKPAAGFYDTGEEQEMSKQLSAEFRPVTLQQLEGKRRKDVEEQLIKQDVKRQKVHEMHDAPGALAVTAGINDPVMVRRKGRMMLPAPQVSEQELEAIAKLSTEALLDEALAEGAGGDATRGLLGEYGPTPLRAGGPSATPAPRTAATGDRIMQEAANLARLAKMATPLVGGENPDLAGSDFSGITPRTTVAATPNPLLAAVTPARGGAGVAATPAGGVSVRRGAPVVAGVSATPAATPGRGGMLGPGATPLATPIRDELGLNDADALAVMAAPGARGGRRGDGRLAGLRAELRAGLGSLPAPQNEYQVVAPDLPEGMDVDGEGDVPFEEDAAEARARRLREEQERLRLEELKKSKALQRGLPRPVSLDSLPAPGPAPGGQLSLRERAELAVAQEVATLLRHDASKYPLPPRGLKEGSKEAKKAAKLAAAAAAAVPPLPEYAREELDAAGSLLATEITALREAMGHSEVAGEEVLAQYLAALPQLTWLPAKSTYVRTDSATPTDRAESLKYDFDCARGEMEGEAKKAARLEQKVGVLLGGLQQRDTRLRRQVEELWEALQQARSELASYQVLYEREQHVAPERIESMVDVVAAQKQREAVLQLRYKGLLRERDDLREALAGSATA